MRKVITTERIPIKLWLNDIEDNALEQAKNVANLPFVVNHVAIMSDSHFGYGCPIGGVVATDNVILPSCVGLDISCGMIATKTSILKETINIGFLKDVMGRIRQSIPVGLNGKHSEPLSEELMPEFKTNVKLPIITREWDNARKSLKSLGSGNHFLELQVDLAGYIWIMIHSGSRNLGKKVADHYIEVANKLNGKYFSVVDKKQELAFLPLDTEEAHLYLDEMNYCVEFALANRQLMMNDVCSIIRDVCSVDVDFDSSININHNYVRFEHYYKKNVLVHRKGATSAKKDELGIIPGSQGSKSFIVRGLGNPESFQSCSHGAGRVMGRKEAVRRLNLKDEIKKLDDQGIIHGMRNQKDLEEAISAYKDINVVMENQSDLVEILVELSPIASIKG